MVRRRMYNRRFWALLPLLHTGMFASAFNMAPYWNNSIATSLFTALALTISEPNTSEICAPAAENPAPNALVCVGNKCASQLKDCFADSGCQKCMGCLFTCKLKDEKEQGACQVRCMDLYDSPQMQTFTKCALTDSGCVPPQKEDTCYTAPPLSAALEDFDARAVLSGRWFIAAGLNPTFDLYDCQVHDFYAPPTDPQANPDNADIFATFSYRVPLEEGKHSPYFTRTEDKALWIDPNRGGLLHLRLRPNRMNYKDDWYILGHGGNQNAQDEWFVLVYRGKNAAWSGYGGSNIYTRSGKLPNGFGKERAAIQKALKKGGLELSDFVVNDNSCKVKE